jgi:hypothetical protein
MPIRTEITAMIRTSRLTALLPTLVLALSTGGTLSLSGVAAADDTPPPR